MEVISLENKKQKDSIHKGENHENNHHHGGIFGGNTELIFSLLCGALLGIGYLISITKDNVSLISITLYVIAYFFGGFFTIKEAISSIKKGKFEIDFLMILAAIGAAFLGEWAEGALLLFLFSAGHALEHFAMNRARNSISALADIAPRTAIVRIGKDQKEVPIEDLTVGDIVIVKPNSKISADGVVVKGKSSVNQAPITGESMPVDKIPISNPDNISEKNLPSESRVFSGTINGTDTLEVKVLKEANDSTLSRLIKLVKETESQKSPTQLFTDRFEKYFVPAILILVFLLLFAFLVLDETFSESFYRAMAVLVAASPCALAISTPSAVLSGVARAARGGVLIKGGLPLENLGELKAIAFDKTGTLTKGVFEVDSVYPVNGYSEEEIIKFAAYAETHSNHPIADSIRKAFGDKIKEELIQDYNEIAGHGISIVVDGKEILAGNDKLMQKEKVDFYRNNEIGTIVYVAYDKQFVGSIAISDQIKADSYSAIQTLKRIGIKKTVMLTGDSKVVGKRVGELLEVDEVHAELLPQNKVEEIEKLDASKNAKDKILFVGDGINDTPVLARADVGMAMGGLGSDAAIEAADIVIMTDEPSKIATAISLAKRTRRIVWQNIIFALGVKAIFLLLGAFGIATMWEAVFSDVGVTLIAVLNAMRILKVTNDEPFS